MLTTDITDNGLCSDIFVFGIDIVLVIKTSMGLCDYGAPERTSRKNFPIISGSDIVSRTLT